MGKKYGSRVEKILREMLQFDPVRRITFTRLEEELPCLTKSSHFVIMSITLENASEPNTQTIRKLHQRPP